MTDQKPALPAGRKNYTSALIVLTSLFFMWGFITCMNDILIPFFRKMFELDRFQSMMVQFAFFTAYFVGSLIYFIVSARKGDPISRIGYKNGIIWGLVISAFACLLFYPAAELQIFGLFLGALFILALGFTLLQIAANPYVALLGPPETASSRLNLSQAFNSLGTTIAPIIGGYLVFHYFAKMGTPLINQNGIPVLTDSGEPLSALGVQLPYLIFAGVFLSLAVLFRFTHLPRFTSSSNIEKGAGALGHRHLVLGMIAIFMYVGAEVSIGSSFINYAGELLAYPEMEAKNFLAFYWGGAMIGRFLGAISLSDIQKIKKYLLMLATSILTFFLIYGVIYLESGSQFEFSRITPFLIFLALNYIGFIIGKSLPGRTLAIFAFIVIGLLATTLVSDGAVALWTIIGIGLFNSIMWSNIFTLAIKDLEKNTAQGSSLLVMMILGGAIIPVLQGAVADALNGYHLSYFVPIFCYIYLMYYGWKGYIPRKTLQ
ncbi:MAG: fucose permease [Bacteroidetes bacterium GWC2_33_15]|nr:MAG: fucose permease [Bacteroidetes bacterium GWA2_33_15]OFX50154.1 MAG: fucose permease [Bacteroidetes bacterium GWC2_33_15]OFX65306.1 MAG: fucose permease [Bacteroidetes bacterium GWB2_32_14]OFX70533.1 MAG: fucose permease [Bacteroidetes bacterium GWD2_33_33]HAN19593.1 MFS transporter [Bacteroidales bacterium]